MNCLLLPLLLVSFTARAADDAQTRVNRIENGLLPPVALKGRTTPRYTIAERMKLYAVPGVSIAFIDKGQVAWMRAYGFADVAHKTPVTPETLFQAASLSKPVTAAAALRLVEQGLVSLDTDVNEKLRSWKAPDNEFTKFQKVTVRRILSHSAGLGVGGFDGYSSTETVPSLVQILDGKKPANSGPIRVEAVPGSAYAYSGGGYTILQQLLIDVSGKPFSELLRDLVLSPAGMTHSSFSQPLPANLLAQAAVPYVAGGAPGEGGAHTYPELAAAGLWTTAEDLARYAIAIQNSYAGKKDSLLAKATAREMLTDQRQGRGLGFGLPAGSPQRFAHRGLNFGFAGTIQAFAEEGGQGVVIMTNTDEPGQFNEELLRAVAAEYGWKDLMPVERAPGRYPADLAKLAGAYAADPKNPYAVTLKNKKLWLKIGDGPAAELLPSADGRFFTLAKASTYRFADGGARLIIDDGAVSMPKISP